MRRQIQEARQPSSELLRAAGTGEPQTVTRNGAEVAVVIAAAEYRRLRGGTSSLTAHLPAEPSVGVDIGWSAGTIHPTRST